MNLTDKKVTEKKVQDHTKKVQGHHSLNHDFPVLYFILCLIFILCFIIILQFIFILHFIYIP